MSGTPVILSTATPRDGAYCWMTGASEEHVILSERVRERAEESPESKSDLKCNVGGSFRTRDQISRRKKADPTDNDAIR